MDRVDDMRMLKNYEEKNGQPSGNGSCVENTVSGKRHRRNCRKLYLVGAFFLLAGGIFCVLGGLYASKLNGDAGKHDKQCSKPPLPSCDYSSEAKRVQLPEFLSKVRQAYYKLYPETHAWENYISDEELTKNVQER